MIEKKLSQWAKEQDISYVTAWRHFKAGKITNAFQTENGIIVKEALPVPLVHKPIVMQDFMNAPVPVEAGGMDVVKASTSRRNRAATIERTDKFKNIEEGILPYSQDNKGNINIKEAIVLCQKSYANIAIFRSVIDLMTEFSVSDIFFKGGSAKSREFFTALFKKINLDDFQDQFFREYFRGGNVFSYRFDSKIQSTDLVKITQTFGTEIAKGANVSLPTRYIILNPADIEAGGTVNFASTIYYKTLNAYELARLRYPKVKEDEEVLNSFDAETRALIKKTGNASVLIKLDPERIYTTFFKKQSYESFAIPFAFPVLEDLNWKMELKKVDQALGRCSQQAILLITLGAKPDDGGINPLAMRTMQEIFANQSVGRAVIADWTTKAEFIIPQIADILDPKKYEIVNRDIEIGLGYFLITDDKFSAQSIKLDLFAERVTKAREAFLDQFLNLEIKRISKDLGFKNFPVPYFKKINVKNKLEYDKLYVRLAELGLLTADEVVQAINDDILPSPEDSLESQEKYRTARKAEMYAPLLGKGQDSTNMQEGRPTGLKAPKSKNTIKPRVKGNFSMKKITENLIHASKLANLIEKELLKLFKIKELDENQKSVAEGITELIICNERPEQWEQNIVKYINNPIDSNSDRVQEIQELCYDHQITSILGGILYASIS